MTLPLPPERIPLEGPLWEAEGKEGIPTLVGSVSPAFFRRLPPSAESHPMRCPLAWVLLASLGWGCLTPFMPPLVAAEASAARTGIRAAEAGRHVQALSDDAFEGREGGSRGGRAAGAYIVETLRGLGIDPAGDEGTYFQRFGTMRNIMAIVPGSDPDLARELVVVGAHYDHVGYGTPSNSYGPTGLIHNGADDNASGVAGLLEIAEVLHGLPTRPRRPILLAFWDGEEKGLLGSWHFLRVRPTGIAPLRPVFSLNIDMIGRLRGDRVEVYGARSAIGLRPMLVAANRSSDLELAFDWEIVDDSDHYPFITAGVPTLMLHTGLHDEYHRPSDDAHLVNLIGVEAVGRLAFDVVTLVADTPGGLPEFRAACRGEKGANRDVLERAVPPDEVGSGPRPRWGMSTRVDPGDPTAPVVVRVVPGSPLAVAGLEIGDRIIGIDGEAVVDQGMMIHRLASTENAVTLSIDRRGRTRTLDVQRVAPPDR
ncbi:MAG: M20/M25/M40 family metallo-hydrolase [Planctomycetota bacterium]|nr:MAG: M20/M25/M40 family metallo-hydrolase [Planctomycetota bacterium]